MHVLSRPNDVISPITSHNWIRISEEGRGNVPIFSEFNDATILTKKNEWKTTHIELPDNFVDSGFGINAAFKVDVVAFFNAVRIQGGAQAQTNTRQI